MSSEDREVVACPVDHSKRAAWVEKARTAKGTEPSNSPSSTSASQPLPAKTRPLSRDRETSTIPRATTAPLTSTPQATLASSSATCTSAPPSSPSAGSAGNWIYPSEQMFFDAMRRKRYSPRTADMASIVPLHNAVNEKAWAEILAWERRMPWARSANTGCGGPRLRSFAGDSTKLSPRARWNGLLGYKPPFDRHDWVVERCSGEASGVEYVIDFYEGKDEVKGKINFYLDVRPKLNSWEGWKMRLASWVGFY